MIVFGEKELAAEAIAKPDANIKELLQKPGVDANFLLYEASKRNCIVRMEELVNNYGANVNTAVAAKSNINYPVHKAPPLFAAVEDHAVKAVEWLLAAGADPDGKCFIEDSCITPLWNAADNGNVRLGKLLLDHGADVNAAKSIIIPPTHPHNGNTPLFIAVQNHHPAMVSLLLSFNADPNKHLQPRTMHTRPPIEIAIGCGYPRLVAQLLNADFNIVSPYCDELFCRIQQTKISLDQYQRTIKDEELVQIKDLLSVTLYLIDNPTYESAKAAEKAGEYKKALELLSAVRRKCPCTQVMFDIDRIVEDMYGVKGSDGTMSIWDTVPLMTQTEPPEYIEYAWTHHGGKIYRHGGVDRLEIIPQRDELWELDIETRIWRLMETSGKSPGPRTGHTLFSYKGSLYLWGGRNEYGDADARLYRLPIKGENRSLKWDIVKAKMPPGGRENHAGVVYKGKYYITGGDLESTNQPTDECWMLNLKTFKWKPLKCMPIDRKCHGMWAANDKLFVLGGRREHDVSKDKVSHMMYQTFSIENFISYDLIGSKAWCDEPIIGDRIHDVSEFTVLPLYKDREIDDDPTSVVIWGGYCEMERANGPNIKSEKEMVAHYGEDAPEFARCQYRKRLFRFYPNTKVWKKLRTTTLILPKAQSFAAEIKSGDNSLNLLIGGGYGFTAESMIEKPSHYMGIEMGTPRVSNKVYHVITGNIERYAALDNIDGNSWAHSFAQETGDLMSQFSVDFSPASPTLHNMIDITHQDFSEPPCQAVSPNDEVTLLGVRVTLTGLMSRSDLNGKIGRCGRWFPLNGRYEVYIPIYEGGPLAISVKPSNLNVAPNLKLLEHGDIQRFLSSSHFPKRFPSVCFTVLFGHDTTQVKGSLVDQIANTPEQPNDKFQMTLMDTYHGPVSREVQPIIRAMALPMPGAPESVSKTTIGCVISQVEVKASSTAVNSNRQNLYANLVKRQKDRLTPRIKEFENSVTSISDSTVFNKCGNWLKLKVQIDGSIPAITRELLVDPDISMQSLHNHVLCPAIGWAPYNHSYSFRRIGMNFFADYQGGREKDEHEYAMRMMDKEVWMGPKKSLAVDNAFIPFYIGCMANDKNMTLGQLFSLDDEYGKKNGELFLQYVVDLGCWWTHSISVTRHDESDGTRIPSEATVAYLIGGEGGSIPEDVGGAQPFFQLIQQLAGKLHVDSKEDVKGMTCRVNPSNERWWQLFNDGYRGKANRIHFRGNPFGFHLERSRAELETELRRPKRKTAEDMRSFHPGTGLLFEMDKKCTILVQKKPTDSCAVCGVTVALKLCSACGTVAYCGKEHSVQNWPKHKAACKLARKKKGKKKGKK